MTQDLETCLWCGRSGQTEEHHLFRRSTSPQLSDDSKNLVRLCFICHKAATENHEVEQIFQQYFFNRPERELTIEIIRDKMMSGDMFSPRDISRYRTFLGGMYDSLDEQLIKLILQKPGKVEEFKSHDAIRSEARAERLYLATPEGMRYMELRMRLKSIEKMLSSLKTAFENYKQESFNQF